MTDGHMIRLLFNSYIWENLSNGYSQGMCDLLAPLLVILEDGKNNVVCDGGDEHLSLSFFLSPPLFSSLSLSLSLEELTFLCYCSLMERMELCFPPKPGVTQRMTNLQSLLQVG